MVTSQEFKSKLRDVINFTNTNTSKASSRKDTVECTTGNSDNEDSYHAK